MNTNPFETYTSPKGHQYRVTGIEKIEESGSWINGTLKYNWIVTIYYTSLKKFARLVYDYQDKLIKIL